MAETSERDEALTALRLRGVNDPDRFIDQAPAPAILGACRWFDRQNGGGVGLLVWKIKQGGVIDPQPSAVTARSSRRPVYDQQALPVFWMAHQAWEDAWAERTENHPEQCPGRLLVVEARWPVLVVECDACEFLAGLPHRKAPQRILERLGVTT